VLEQSKYRFINETGRSILNLNAEEPFIYGDIEHLTNLVNNLLDNAIKYSPDLPEIAITTKNLKKV